MPVIKVIGRLKIQMYADDHYPPHFHVVTRDFEVLVEIRNLTILKGERHRRDIAAALDWASANLAILEKAWAQLNAE
jgi:hypothetical protein